MGIELNADQGSGLSERLVTLAQSFLVDRSIFVTKLDLFFSAKGGVLPVEVSLRKIENGEPSANILPYSHTVIEIDDINVSANSQIATTVTFSNPVYLESGEYCFALTSDVKDNKVYTASLGGQDIATSAMISKQPYTGVMFTSSNGRQYNVDQTRDVKFKLYCAKFTSDFGVVDFKLKNDGLSQVGVTYLEKENFITFAGSDVIRIYHENHGFSDGMTVKLMGIEGDLDHMANANNIVTVNGIPYDNVENVNFIVSNVTSTGYTIAVSIDDATKANVTGGSFPYSGAMVTTCVPYSTLVSGISEIVPLKTSSVHKIRTTNEALQVSDYETIEFGSVTFSETQLLVDNINKDLSMSEPESLFYRMELATSDEYVSPVITLPLSSLLFVTPSINNPSIADNLTIDNKYIANLNSNISFTFSNTAGIINVADANDRANVRMMTKGAYVTISGAASANNNGDHRITKVSSDGSTFEVPNVVTAASGTPITIIYRPMFVADEASFGASSKANYITRKISLANPSTAFNVRLTVSKPAGSDVEVYFKTQNSNEISTFNDKEYTKLEMGDIQDTLTNQYVEIESTIDGLNPFDAFVFKVVLKSDSIASYPTIRDLRVIALQ